MRAIRDRLRHLVDTAGSRNRADRVWVAIRAGDTASSGLITHGTNSGESPVFLVYSISKTFTAVAILRLCAAGTLALDATLDRWLPDLPHAGRITVRKLLQHTSGMPDYGGLAEYHEAVRRGAEPWSFAQFLAKADAKTLRFAPGSGWAYSNIGYMILRRLIETVGGADFDGVLRREIIIPLGLRDTRVPAMRDDLRRVSFGASRYLGGNGPAVDVASRYDPRWIATGVIASTAAETARFYEALFTGSLLPAALLDQLRTLVPVGAAAPGRPWIEPAYGLGVMSDLKSPYGPLFGHTGAGPGCSTAAYHFAGGNRPATIVVFSDGEDAAQVEWLTWETAALLQER